MAAFSKFSKQKDAQITEAENFKVVLNNIIRFRNFSAILSSQPVLHMPIKLNIFGLHCHFERTKLELFFCFELEDFYQ